MGYGEAARVDEFFYSPEKTRVLMMERSGILVFVKAWTVQAPETFKRFTFSVYEMDMAEKKYGEWLADEERKFRAFCERRDGKAKTES